MLEISALLWERSKHSGKLCLRKSLTNRRKQQVRRSSSMERALWCLRPRLCASARVLLRGSPGWRGNEHEFTLCISPAVLWLFLRPAFAGSHSWPCSAGLQSTCRFISPPLQCKKEPSVEHKMPCNRTQVWPSRWETGLAVTQVLNWLKEKKKTQRREKARL